MKNQVLKVLDQLQNTYNEWSDRPLIPVLSENKIPANFSTILLGSGMLQRQKAPAGKVKGRLYQYKVNPAMKTNTEKLAEDLIFQYKDKVTTSLEKRRTEKEKYAAPEFSPTEKVILVESLVRNNADPSLIEKVMNL